MINHLFTRRLKLRKICKQDIPLIVTWSNSQEVYGEYLSMENFSFEECLLKFDNGYFWNNNSKTYLMEIKEGSIPIGTIQYWRKAENPVIPMISLKIAIPSYRGKGYGTESQKGLIRELFLKGKFEAVEMLTDINNIPQQKCLTKLDFDNVGIKEYPDHNVKRQGYVFRLTKEKYEKSGIYIYYYDE